jgi:hypothetical protein
MVSSAYQLPFLFQHSERVFSLGRPVNIKVRTTDPLHMGYLKSVIHTFLALAKSGALCGDRIPPWNAEFLVNDVSIYGDEIGLLVERCTLADEALIVLAHLLLSSHKIAPITIVEVVSSKDGDLQLLKSESDKESTYPKAFSGLPFILEDLKPQGGGYSLFFELESPLELFNRKQLEAVLGVWIRTILMGGYSLAPIDPSESYVEPDSNEVTVYGTKVEWAVYKLHADPEAAINALLNILARFHVRSQRIKRLEIS